jgi:hypothetical protein
MSANRETNHDMATDTDIAFLLAEAADEVEIGTAPYQAVLRGGRRRKARRWAMAATAALVIAGSTGTLALAGMPSGSGGRVEPAVTAPSQTGNPGLFGHRTVLASGTDKGKPWKVFVDMWAAPRDGVEAQGQLSAMTENAEVPSGVSKASDLIGKTWYFVHARVGDQTSMVMTGQFEKGDYLSGAEFETGAIRMPSSESAQPGASNRLVIGDVAPTARHVTCTWNDGTRTEVPRAPEGAGFGPDFKPYIRPVKGSQPNWFVCVVPEGKSYKSVKVTG